MLNLRTVSTEKAHRSSSPLSQAVVFGRFLYSSGQVPIPPGGKEAPEGIETQTRAALSNLRAIIESAGGDLRDVIKTTVFLVDASDIAEMNRVYGEFFGERWPARTTVVVASLARPEWLVEIEAIAALRPPRNGSGAAPSDIGP